jgi:hypothetical protein
VVGVIWAARDGRAPDVTLQSELVADDAPPIAVAENLEAYRVVYRIDSYRNGEVATTTQEILVRRPFDGRITLREGPPPGADIVADYRSSQTRFAVSTEGGAQVSFSRPAPAIGDIRFDATIEELVDTELFEVRERRRVLDHECTVYRTGEIVQTFSFAAPTDSNWADACIGEAGVLLEEVAVVDGELALRVLAVEFEAGITIPDYQITVPGEPNVFAPAATLLAELPLDVAPFDGFWHFPTPPEGFEHRGRYLLREPEVPGDPGAPTRDIHADVYVRGSDAVIVQQGPAGSEPTLDDGPARTVDLGDIGLGTIAPGLSGSTVFVETPDERYVFVLGTVASLELEEMVRGMRQSP